MRGNVAFSRLRTSSRGTPKVRPLEVEGLLGCTLRTKRSLLVEGGSVGGGEEVAFSSGFCWDAKAIEGMNADEGVGVIEEFG